jgi:hypothetical protein
MTGLKKAMDCFCARIFLYSVFGAPKPNVLYGGENQKYCPLVQACHLKISSGLPLLLGQAMPTGKRASKQPPPIVINTGTMK